MPLVSAVHTKRVVRERQVVGLRRRPMRVVVHEGPDSGARRDFVEDRILIGSHPQCELALTDQTVSRQHCEIALVEDGYAITDLDSTNGTFLDEARLGSVIIAGPARLVLGETTVELSILDSAVEIEIGSDTRFGPLLGASIPIRRVIEKLRKLAGSDVTVLITGESGTGKEVAARALHEQGPRAEGPFIVVDCGALPETLIESELYGHERGAFTGAVGQRRGAFESAHTGTLFLDEIGEMPLEQQARLLGALERRTVRRIGGSESRPVDVRVIAATNRDLRREINRGRFREDLFFRLAVVTVEMPPLRERVEDIRLYVRELSREIGENVVVDEATMRRLEGMRWDGNVRELRNFLARFAALGDAGLEGLHASAAPAPGVPDPKVPFKVGKAALIEDYERQYISALMSLCENNISLAARTAQIDRMYLLRLLDRYGLRPRRR
jgi:two-component system, NtrC family, response regulator GlrR